LHVNCDCASLGLSDQYDRKKYLQTFAHPQKGRITWRGCRNGRGEHFFIQEENLVDPAWPHLQPVYEFFLQLIVNEGAEVKALKVHITPSFIQ
jgi:hypothetical protein